MLGNSCRHGLLCGPAPTRPGPVPVCGPGVEGPWVTRVKCVFVVTFRNMYPVSDIGYPKKLKSCCTPTSVQRGWPHAELGRARGGVPAEGALHLALAGGHVCVSFPGETHFCGRLHSLTPHPGISGTAHSLPS